MAMSRRSGNSTTTGRPESAHSFSVARKFASRRLSGIVSMAMKFLPSHDQLVTDLVGHNQQNDLVATPILQHAKVADAQLAFRMRVRAQPLGSFGPGSGWLTGRGLRGWCQAGLLSSGHGRP